MDRIYLDNAATSWPKPEAVYQAVQSYLRDNGAPAGRSTYVEALQAQQIVDQTRHRVRELFGAPNDSQIVFTFNGTDALNLCIHGVLRPGDHVVTSSVEHNSVLRPLMAWRQRFGVDVSYVPADEHGVVAADDVAACLRPKTRLVVLTHASNVTGALQPIDEIGAVVRANHSLFLVDAAQTAGHVPIDLCTLPVDMLATSGHKGLLGPLGTGLVCFAPGVASQVHTTRHGGTGTDSFSDEQPTVGPQKFESGNLNVAGLAGLLAGIEYLLARGPHIRAHEAQLTRALLEMLGQERGVTIYGPPADGARVGVVSFNAEDCDPHDVVSLLDATDRIQLRAGLHCAPRIHQSLGTSPRGGTVRASLGPWNTEMHIERLATSLATLVTTMAK